MRLAAGVEYQGAGFSGWQRQAGQRTVQECIESAISKVANHPITVHCAGRTDAGVHASQQVIHFNTSSNRELRSWVLGSNNNLPKDISLVWVKPVADDFHARFSAIARKYRYIILNRETRPAVYGGLVTWKCRRLDENRMTEAATFLEGEHDFTSYQAVSCESKKPVRTIKKLVICRIDDFIIIDIEANGFLRQMVRNIAGVLMLIGMGKQDTGWSKTVLDARERAVGGYTAPAEGLHFISAVYPMEFEIPDVNMGPALMKAIKCIKLDF